MIFQSGFGASVGALGAKAGIGPAINAPYIVNGTSTTGTGTLTLAASPSATGALNVVQYLGTSGSYLVPYVIKEYTDTTFATVSQIEKGIGTVALNASITSATLARTTVQVTQSGSTYSALAPSAITIGTAANVLVFIGASAADIPAFPPYVETSLSDYGGPLPAISSFGSGVNFSGGSAASGKDLYFPFVWLTPVVAKRCTFRVAGAYTGTTGSPTSSIYARIYAQGTNGRPGNLLIDFGALGATNPLNTTGNIASGLHGTGIFLPPGLYWMNFFPTFSGATGTVTNPTWAANSSMLDAGAAGMTGGAPINVFSATGGANPAPDPANVTGYASFGGSARPLFALSST